MTRVLSSSGEDGAVALVPSELLTPPDKSGRQYRVYGDEERRALYDLIFQCRFGPFSDGEERKDWGEIAEALGVSRQTLYTWRQFPDYKEAAARYEQLLVDEGKSSSAGMYDEAVQAIRKLMYGDRSGYVRLEAAKELIRLAGAEQARKDGQGGGAQEMIEFQKLMRTRQGRIALLKQMDMEADPAIDVEAREVQPGGRLPEEVVAENELDRERIAREKALRALEDGHPDGEDDGAGDGGI